MFYQPQVWLTCDWQNINGKSLVKAIAFPLTGADNMLLQLISYQAGNLQEPTTECHMRTLLFFWSASICDYIYHRWYYYYHGSTIDTYRVSCSICSTLFPNSYSYLAWQTSAVRFQHCMYPYHIYRWRKMILWMGAILHVPHTVDCGCRPRISIIKVMKFLMWTTLLSLLTFLEITCIHFAGYLCFQSRLHTIVCSIQSKIIIFLHSDLFIMLLFETFCDPMHTLASDGVDLTKS